MPLEAGTATAAVGEARGDSDRCEGMKSGFEILYVGTLPPHTGGSALSCAQLISGIATAGHSVTAIAPTTGETLQGGERFAVAHPELRIVRYTLPRFSMGPFSGDETTLPLERAEVRRLFSRVTEDRRPDLVILGRESYSGHLAEIASSRGYPVMQWVRGGASWEATYRVRLDEGQDILRGMRHARRLISAADHLTKQLRSLGFENVHTIPNAIDTAQFSPGAPSRPVLDDLGISDNDCVVLVPGGITRRKRPFDVIESAVRAVKKNATLLYVMAGSGPSQSLAELTCREKGVWSRFRFPGWIDHSRMPALMRTADMVLLASEAEGLARVYLEALATERTLIASDIAAAKEVIRDNVNGLLFRLGDTNDLADKTLLAAGDTRLRARLGRQGRLSIEHRSLDTAVESYLNAIETTLA